MVWSIQLCIDHDNDLIAPVPAPEELTVSTEQTVAQFLLSSNPSNDLRKSPTNIAQ
jgi:hypothetical protein